MDGARVVRLLDGGAEDGVERPLLEHELRQRQVDGLGVVRHDVAVLRRLREHQVLDELARNVVQREILQAAAVPALHQDVVHQLADELRPDRVDVAPDDLVLDLLRDVVRRLLLHPQLLDQLLRDARAVPRQQIVARNRLHQQQALVGQVVLALALPLRTHIDGRARTLTALPVALERRHHRRQMALRQRHLNHVLHILQIRYPATLLVRGHKVLAQRVVQLADGARRDVLRLLVAELQAIVLTHRRLARLPDRARNLVRTKRHQ